MTDPRDQVRTYAGRTRAEAATRIATDEEPMAAAGYTLASESWAETIRYGPTSKVLLAIAAVLTAGGWLITPLLSLIAMVFLVAGVMTRTRAGELTVTWTKVDAGARADPSGAPL